MPRLVGKQSNLAIPLSLFVLASIGGLAALEYTGAINVINGFGHDRIEIRSYPERSVS